MGDRFWDVLTSWSERVIIAIRHDPVPELDPMSQFIRVENRKGVSIITLSRPEKRNALTREFLRELNSEVERVQNDPKSRLLVLQAEGPVFCAGMDLKEMLEHANGPDSEQELQADSESYQKLLGNLFSLKIPTLAVLQGPVLAGGTGLVFACDLVIASDGSFFSLPEPKRGIVAAMVCPMLVYRVGVSAASWLLMSGRNLSANEAKSCGLVHQVFISAELESERDQLIESILAGSNLALRTTKQHLHEVSGVDVLEQIRVSAEISAAARRTPDAQEGLLAFQEKRPPNWQVPFKDDQSE